MPRIRVGAEAEETDIEGHGFKMKTEAEEADDVEGHMPRIKI